MGELGHEKPAIAELEAAAAAPAASTPPPAAEPSPGAPPPAAPMKTMTPAEYVRAVAEARKGAQPETDEERPARGGYVGIAIGLAVVVIVIVGLGILLWRVSKSEKGILEAIEEIR